MLERRIRAAAPPGTAIPKPASRHSFRVLGDGTRRGRPALIYSIPNHTDRRRPYQKGVTWEELERAYAQLVGTRELTTEWFRRHLAACYEEGSCNFTTVGGLFQLLGEAAYQRRGVYVRV
jgi:hypothetical protein